ncbi:hypothetical protein PV326_012570 [Microctonus aethiopoides]|nr:hypothetical protein PV326_012570 [Microctonus aethiopoides]
MIEIITDNYIPPHVCVSQSSNNSIQHQFISSHSDDSVGSNVCRICHHPSNVDEALVAPCRCKGTLAYVHMSCLEHWLNQSCRNRCELCHFRFNAIETLRYRWSESLRIWMSHPRNRRYVQSDILVLGLLTFVTIGLVAVCLLGMRYFIIEGKKIGVSRVWTQGAIIFFLTIVVVGYFTTAYLLVKDIREQIYE